MESLRLDPISDEDATDEGTERTRESDERRPWWSRRVSLRAERLRM